jgi:uncharacterized protein (DUF2267 family)
MATTGLDVFDSTIQETNTWLHQIAERLGTDSRHTAYQALRGVLHALRDHLPLDESAQLAAQLPMLIRGIYYEAWDPSKVPLKERDRETFLAQVRRAFPWDATVDPEQAARAVFAVLTEHVSSGEIEQVRHSLPKAIRELWP